MLFEDPFIRSCIPCIATVVFIAAPCAADIQSDTIKVDPIALALFQDDGDEPEWKSKFQLGLSATAGNTDT